MNVAFYIAKRYLKSKSSKNAVNIITRIAICAVVVGAMALFIVLSGFAGLRDFSLQFTNVFDSDLKIQPVKGKTISVTPSKIKKLQEIEGVISFSKVIEERVFLQYKGKQHIASIKGVDTNYGNVIKLDSIMFHDNWLTPNQSEAVIGLGTSSRLSLGTYDYENALEVYVPKPGTGQINALDPTEAFTKRSLIVSGVYYVNEDLDSRFVFTDFEFARELLGLNSSQVTSIAFKISETANEDALRTKILNVFDEKVVIKNRIQQNDALYKMLNAENLFVYVFVSLIAAIAIFNIAGTIIMMILEKKSTIKTLVSLGLTLKNVRKIFFYEGLLLTLLGTAIGLLLGVCAVLLQKYFGWIPITPNLPYPVEFEFTNVLIVFVTISTLGALASKIAAARITDKLLS